MTYKLSPQQVAVLDWVKNGKGSLNLIARAGTGKTSTLMEVAKAIRGYTGFMGSFNKAIADEFKLRLSKQQSWNVTGATLHSAGISAWRQVAPKVQVDGQKVRGIAKKKHAYDKKLVTAICDTVSMAKQTCLGVGVPYIETSLWQEIIDYYNIQEDVPKLVSVERFIEYCIETYEHSLSKCEEVVDFDDMLLAPLYYKTPIKKYDWVLVDEAQDTNQARRLLSFAMMGDESRMVAVGDPCQAIYGFAGASSNSMDLIEAEMRKRGEFTSLPLSVTYRCPKRVVDLAQVWVPDIEAHANNPEGSLWTINHKQFWEEKLTGKDVVLCRNTRPLVGVARRLRDKGIPCIVEGMSGKGLIALALKWGEDIRLDRMKKHLNVYRDAEVAKWLKKGNEEKADYVRERCDILFDLCRGLGASAKTSNLASRISMLFDGDGRDRGDVLTLCTIHRSKGREWNRVYLIGRNRYMPSPYAEADWEKKQEDNLAYVAVTRSKSVLVEVEVPPRRRDELEWWDEASSHYDNDDEVEMSDVDDEDEDEDDVDRETAEENA